MKKIVVIAVAIILSMVATEAFAQSQAYSGDKSLKEIRRTMRIIRRQINVYEKSKTVIAKKRVLSHADSLLISNYQNKIDELEINLNSLIITGTDKGTRQSVNLTGKDPKKIAEAYLLVKYADNIGKNKNVIGDSTSQNLKGIIVNNWYYEVTARVTGPGNFFREFNIKPNRKSPVFTLPVIGEYTTVFITSNDSKMITKSVGPNIVYYDDAEAYDYKVTLPRH